MILGSHQLKGKVEQLNEPFTVMEKQYDENKNLESYQVVGVVRQKLMFNQYPKVIMR
jgi:predicted translin family RNA/ssDNA-binding protein